MLRNFKQHNSDVFFQIATPNSSSNPTQPSRLTCVLYQFFFFCLSRDICIYSFGREQIQPPLADQLIVCPAGYFITLFAVQHSPIVSEYSFNLRGYKSGTQPFPTINYPKTQKVSRFTILRPPHKPTVKAVLMIQSSSGHKAEKEYWLIKYMKQLAF